MTRFVLDASIAGCWAFSDETHAAAAKALDLVRGGEACVPSHWWFEIRNILIVNERRKRLSETDTSVFLRLIGRLPISVDRSPDETMTLVLARRHRLTMYNAAYLELALRTDAALATLDTDLARAAQAGRVGFIG